MKVSFESWENLQRRLILVPRIEEEGRGAIVHALEETIDDTSSLLLGSSLVRLVTDHDNDQSISSRLLYELDFASILSVLRESPSPIVLEFEPRKTPRTPLDPSIEEEKKEDNTPFTDPTMRPVVPSPAPLDSNDDGGERSTSAMNMKSLLSWTAQLRESSIQMASEAAQAVAKAAQEHQRAPKKDSLASLPSADLQATADTNNTSKRTVQLALYEDKGGDWATLQRPTTGSTLCVRQVSDPRAALSSSDYSFQWYRSTLDQERWNELTGATTAAFQPTAMETGYFLKCCVYISANLDTGEESTCMEFETPDKVHASRGLFNGARQALLRGAQMGGWQGLDKAWGRTFSLEVQMGLQVVDPDTLQKVPSSLVKIRQTDKNVCELIHSQEEPLLGVTASIPDYAESRKVELHFPRGIPESSLLAALVNEDGKLLLEAPNRLARESLLLSLGITNFSGKPQNLTESTILFFMDTEDTNATSGLISTVMQEEDGAIHSDHSVEDGGLTIGSCSTTSEEFSSKANTTASAPSTPERIVSPRPPLTDSILLTRSQSLDLKQRRQISDLETSGADIELHRMRAKLVRKDKIISELQRQIARVEGRVTKAEQTVKRKQEELAKSKGKVENLSSLVKRAEKKITSHIETFERVKADHKNELQKMESVVSEKDNRIALLEKAQRNLENEKALLSAAVEARESKLEKLEKLKDQVKTMTGKVEVIDTLRSKLDMAEEEIRRLNTLVSEREATAEGAKIELKAVTEEKKSLSDLLNDERAKLKCIQEKYDAQAVVIQKVTAERNSFRQKSESKSKELGRICREGRSIQDIERMIADDSTRRQEVQLLRQSKRQMQTELDDCRVAHARLQSAHQMSGAEHEMNKVLERNAELERLLSNLTEFVNAKEMQLETMKQVNEALLKELSKSG